MVTVSVRSAARDLFPQIKQFLAESDDIYPGIERWWERRVVPGLASGHRVCRAGLCDEQVVGLAIGKHSRGSAKLCTLRVAETHRGQRLGERMVCETLRDLLDRGCRHVHYTISEKTVAECGSFFDPYGFAMTGWQRNLYAHGLDELAFSAPAQTVRCAVPEHHPTNSASDEDSDVVLLSIRPESARLIEQGRKLVEFRRRFTSRFKTGRAVFYVTAPVRQVRLMALIANVVRGTPGQLWEQLGSLSGVDRGKFRSYFDGVAEGAALLLTGIMPLRRPMHAEELRRSHGQFRPPVSYSFLPRDSALLETILAR